MRKKLFKWFQILISLLFVYLFLNKIKLGDLSTYLINIKWNYVLISMLLYMVSQFISSIRLRVILNHFSLPILFSTCNKLYLLGMFYNFFLPGGIGGDAVIALILKKKYSWKLKSLAKCLILARLIGLTALVSIIFIIEQGQFFFFNDITRILFFFTIPIVSFYVLNYFFKTEKIYLKTLFMSYAVQFFQLFCVFFILKALSIPLTLTLSLLTIFLLSALASVVSFAGIGVREYLFMLSGDYLNTSVEMTASVGITFTLIAAIISFFGLYYVVFQKKI